MRKKVPRPKGLIKQKKQERKQDKQKKKQFKKDIKAFKEKKAKDMNKSDIVELLERIEELL